VRSFKVRRSHIGYMRNLTGKAARLKELKKDI
jgi:ribosomal protein L19